MSILQALSTCIADCELRNPDSEEINFLVNFSRAVYGK